MSIRQRLKKLEKELKPQEKWINPIIYCGFDGKKEIRYLDPDYEKAIKEGRPVPNTVIFLPIPDPPPE